MRARGHADLDALQRARRRLVDQGRRQPQTFVTAGRVARSAGAVKTGCAAVGWSRGKHVLLAASDRTIGFRSERQPLGLGAASQLMLPADVVGVMERLG